jgi:FkbH-like protein
MHSAGGWRAALGILRAGRLYRRGAALASLPLARPLAGLPGLRALGLLAYSPSIHLGREVQLWGDILDPDLTFIGDQAVIGWQARLVAHAFNVNPDGSYTFVTAPIHVGARATIGGGCVVSMGCRIGEDAVLEAGSRMPPFAEIPRAEVWGGDPARFLRRRAAGLETAEARDVARRAPGPARDADPMQAARLLVAEALGVRPEDLGQDPGLERHPAWDSMGQIAIAAAVCDRTGRGLTGEAAEALRTLDDVAQLLAGRAGGGAAGEPARRGAGASAVAEEIPAELYLMPLIDPAVATRHLAGLLQGREESGVPLQVSIAATFVAQPVATSLRLWARAHGVAARVDFCDFGQVIQPLLDREGPFHRRPGGLKAVLVRGEDLPGESDEARRAAAKAMLDAVEAFGAAHPGTLVVSPLLQDVRGEGEEEGGASGLRDLAAEWDRRLAAIACVERLAMPGRLAGLGPFAMPERLGAASVSTTAGEAEAALARAIGIGLARAACRRAPLPVRPKVVALDADGTLWGGVVAEDGVEGLTLGGGGEGEGFRRFQSAILRLKERGLMLALVSRNEEEDVWRAFEQNKEMILRREDLAAWRINWRSKAENLAEIAAELNVGTDAIVLLDDDAAVRLEVAARLPEIKTPPLAEDPSRRAAMLEAVWLFDAAGLTREDAARSRMMGEERRRREVLAAAPSLEAYLGELGLAATLRRAGRKDVERIAQLTLKTNQFNLSLRRRPAAEIEPLLDRTWVMEARDRHGEYGLIGVAILDPAPREGEAATLETFLMSCRALGRGIETAFLRGIGEAAGRLGARELLAPFIAGPRNAPILEFLARSGFVPGAQGAHRLGLSDLPAWPAHIAGRETEGYLPVSGGEAVRPAAR